MKKRPKRQRFTKGSKVRTNYDISCNKFTVPAGTIVTIIDGGFFDNYYEIILDDGRWMDDVEGEAFTLVE